MSRPRKSEFTAKTKEQALARSGGFCECDVCRSGIALPLKGYPVEFHHYVEVESRGDASLENCRAVRKKPCHEILTGIFKTACAKADRVRQKAAGARRPKQTIKSRGFEESKKTPKRLQKALPVRSRDAFNRSI